jgi:hypothetical protein
MVRYTHSHSLSSNSNKQTHTLTLIIKLKETTFVAHLVSHPSLLNSSNRITSANDGGDNLCGYILSQLLFFLGSTGGRRSPPA